MTEEKKESWYARHRESALAKANAYRAAHREKYRNYWKDYYAKNKDVLKEKQRAHLQKTKKPRIKKSKPTPPAHPTPDILDIVETEVRPTFVKQQGWFLVSWE